MLCVSALRTRELARKLHLFHLLKTQLQGMVMQYYKLPNFVSVLYVSSSRAHERELFCLCVTVVGALGLCV
jgi:hypothetical protein